MTARFSAFLWPDHVIGKRESQRIREEHNALYNSHAELLAALQQAEQAMQDALDGGEFWRENFAGADLPVIRAVLAKVPK